MALLKDRTRFSSKGLGQLEIKEVLPSNDAAYQKLGYLGETNISDISEMEEVKDEAGSMANAIERTRAARLKAQLMQVGIDEISYITGATNKYHSVRYSGMVNDLLYQWYAMEQGKIIRQVDRQFVNQLQKLPFEFLALQQEPTTFTTPLYHMAETKGRIYTDNLQLWANPRWLGTPDRLTAKLFDISGFGRHGTLNSDYAAIWQTGTPESFLRFDGVNDQCDFGNVCNISQTADVLIEGFFRIVGSNGVQHMVAGKKVAGGNDAGWMIYRTTGNKLGVKLSDGTSSAFVVSTSNVLQNVWTHLAVAIDRNGNGLVYINGVLDATVAVSSIGNSTNTNSLFLGRDATSGSSWGNVDIGTMRFFDYGADGLPANIASIVAAHYAAEKGYHGL